MLNEDDIRELRVDAVVINTESNIKELAKEIQSRRKATIKKGDKNE